MRCRATQGIDELLQIDAAVGFFGRMDKQVAVLANREIAFPPACDIVQLGGVGGRPAVGRFAHLRDDGRDFCIQGNIPPGGMRRRRRQ